MTWWPYVRILFWELGGVSEGVGKRMSCTQSESDETHSLQCSVCIIISVMSSVGTGDTGDTCQAVKQAGRREGGAESEPGNSRLIVRR